MCLLHRAVGKVPIPAACSIPSGLRRNPSPGSSSTESRDPRSLPCPPLQAVRRLALYVDLLITAVTSAALYVVDPAHNEVLSPFGVVLRHYPTVLHVGEGSIIRSLHNSCPVFMSQKGGWLFAVAGVMPALFVINLA
ncbi:hypothetical protein F5Y19DRAFT_418974 [Xylariaceae sp. FL1651]|nr:hypothetical protein F5Y19DRAFT_418974 [Xylariaceae sp. FL1651]